MERLTLLQRDLNGFNRKLQIREARAGIHVTLCVRTIEYSNSALRFFTENPARVIGLAGVKGVLAPGADADLLALDGELAVKHVLARGRLAVRDGQAILKGRFE